MSFLKRTDFDEEPIVTTSLYLHCLEVIVNALFYNAQLTISLLDLGGQTAFFFHQWLKKINKFYRVHDRKLSIMAIISMLHVLPVVSNSLGEGLYHLLVVAVKMFNGLPRAVSGRYQRRVFLTC